MDSVEREEAKKFLGLPPPTSDLLAELENIFYDVWKIKSNGLSSAKLLVDAIRSGSSLMESRSGDIPQVDRPRFLMLWGKLLSLHESFAVDAKVTLSKAVKLMPEHIHGWNLLGEAYCQAGEVDIAQTVLLGALQWEENPATYRNLSILTRKKAKPEETLKGIDYAKKAVSLDPSDGESWAVLGNSYLAAFFITEQMNYVKQAIVAYTNAEEKDAGPDLHYNKAVALKFIENYEAAFSSFRRAMSLDNSFSAPITALESLSHYMNTVMTSLQNRGKLKSRKLNEYQKALKNVLGPEARRKLPETCREITIKQLQEGLNINSYLSGKVIWTLLVDSSFPYTTGIIDSEGDTAVLTIFNVAEAKGFIIGQALTLLHPQMNAIDFSYDNRTYRFIKIRVDDPTKNVLVNCKPVARDFRGKSAFSTF